MSSFSSTGYSSCKNHQLLIIIIIIIVVVVVVVNYLQYQR